MTRMDGVFEISSASRYDDLIAERYHFPGVYFRAAEACVGDWIIYRETGPARSADGLRCG